MVRIRGRGSCEVQLTQGKGPSWTVDRGRNPVCFVPFLGEQKKSELSECMFVSSPVTNAVGCFDFTKWTGDFLSTLNKITQCWAREQGVCAPRVCTNISSMKQFHLTLTSATALLSTARGWRSSCSVLRGALVQQTFFGNFSGKSLAAFGVTFDESTCWYGVRLCHEMKTMACF